MSGLITKRVTEDDWDRISELFGPRGLTENCWCTYFRMPARDYSNCGPAERADALRSLVERGAQVGVLGSLHADYVGWVGVGPRTSFPRLERSRVAELLPDDDIHEIWSIVCVYLSPVHRRQGLVSSMVDTAVQWAREEGAALIEAYPVDDRQPDRPPDRTNFHGRVSMFESCGFTVVEERLTQRALVRRAFS